MKGQALHIGINYCNRNDAADCQLDGAIPDALALRDATDLIGFRRLQGDGTLLEAAATEKGILDAVRTAAEGVQFGELLVVTFSGLGAGPDLTKDKEKLLGLRGWVTYDRKVVDVNEILGALSATPKGAVVLVVSACCFMGPRIAARMLGTRISSARYDRDIRFDGRETLFERFAARAMSEGPRARAALAESAAVFHLAASGLDEMISDGTATDRSPFVDALIKSTAGGIQPPFCALIAPLQQLQPVPQLETFPGHQAFDRQPFLAKMGIMERRTA